MIRTRFAPSPTGLLHLGNMRTALFSALLAKRDQGHFILRIEDTDPERSQEVYFHALMEDLHWLGLDWQEGPKVEGESKPYLQAQRLDIYEKYYQFLLEKKLAYPCFCSEKELELERRAQNSAGLPPRYSGTCAHLSAEQVAAKYAKGLQPTLRFRVPKGEDVFLEDLVVGKRRYKTDDIGDFIIRRSNGLPAFFFCNAVDDALMGVTQVLRGVDHVDNTPRQVMILKALALPIPEYGHISLIVNEKGEPLSKRTGSSSIFELREKGYFPLAVNNHLARLGHYYANENLLSLEELAENFSIKHLGHSAAKHDAVQLEHWQKLTVLQLSAEDLWQWIRAQVQHIIPEDAISAFIEIVRHNIILPEEAVFYAHMLFSDDLVVSSEAQALIEEAGSEFFQVAAQALAETGVDWKLFTQYIKEHTHKKGKALFMPLRAALTGQIHGPELAPTLVLLGIERAKKRLVQWS